MPDSVIERINILGRADGQPTLMTFTDRLGCPVGDLEEHDTTGVYDDAHLHENEDVNFHQNIGNIIAHENADELGVGNDYHVLENQVENQDQIELPDPDPEPDEVQVIDHLERDHDPDVIDVEDHQMDHPMDPMENQNLDDQVVDPIPLCRSTRNRNPIRRLDPTLVGQTHHDRMFAQLGHPDGVETAFMQLSLKCGLSTYGNRGIDAVNNELSQLHHRVTFMPIHLDKLVEKKKIMESHMFLEQKRDSSIKARLVAGGNRQRDFVSKEEVGSPTAATESVLITSVIDAHQCRDVSTVDIPNAC